MEGDMDDFVFRVIVPACLVFGLAALAAMRILVRRRTRREAVRVAVVAGTPTASDCAASVLLIASVVMAADVVLRAVWPRAIEAALTLPLFADATAVRWGGLALMAAGLAVYFVGLFVLGASWRIGIDRDQPGPLVTAGPFAFVRHPLYSGVLLSTIGLALLTADVVVVAATAAVWSAVPIQARLEEEFLAARYPEYEAYRARTGCFAPRWS
jgi:protein-S-isoprenylcysteine O-methyltransferase Ste14